MCSYGSLININPSGSTELNLAASKEKENNENVLGVVK